MQLETMITIGIIVILCIAVIFFYCFWFTSIFKNLGRRETKEDINVTENRLKARSMFKYNPNIIDTEKLT